MSDFSVKAILSHFNTIDIINSKKKTSIDTVNSNKAVKQIKSRYALRSDYIPRTDTASAAFEISKALNDQENFALHFANVKSIGSQESYRLLHETLDDVKEASKKGYVINNPAALYNWKVNQLLRRSRKI